MKKYAKTILLASALGMLSFSACAQTVVVVGAKSTTSSMSTEQVSQVFMGKSTTHTPVDQDESNPIRGEFYKKVTGKDAAQVKATWSKLVFTGKATMPRAMSSSAEVKRMLATDPNAIGYIEKSAIDGSVKTVLTIQ